jgi:hypothetical protein
MDCFSLRDQFPVDRPQTGQVFWFGEQLRLERLQPGSKCRPTVPSLFRTDQPEGRVLGKTLGIVHVLITRQPAVHGLAQQVRQRKLRVFPTPWVGQVLFDELVHSQVFVQLSDQNQTSIRSHP